MQKNVINKVNNVVIFVFKIMFSFIYQIIKLLQNNIESLVVQGHNPIFSIYLS